LPTANAIGLSELMHRVNAKRDQVAGFFSLAYAGRERSLRMDNAKPRNGRSIQYIHQSDLDKGTAATSSILG
jgi:hypothetical protein